jgi:hypothetical protein
MRLPRLLAAVLTLACASATGPAARQTPQPDVFALLRTVDGMDARRAWPGFRPADWPIAVFDGNRTLLLRHPSPPPEFAPLDGHPGVLAMAGRHSAVSGNSTTTLGGARTATIVARPGDNRENILLAYVEELFHVFWLQRHTAFRPNEMARYTYPVKDARNLQRVFAENEALARALDAPDADGAARWAAAMLQVRRERERALTPDARAFETGLEMMEGTANAVARVLVGLPASATSGRLRAACEADQLRWRYYDSGAAICLLLDRLQPGWQLRIDADAGLTTLAALEAAVAATGAKPLAFTAAESSQFEQRAAAAIADLSARQAKVRSELLGRRGPRILMEVGDGRERFRVTRFDPINLLVLDAGEVAHPRYLTLSGAAGTIEVVNPAFAPGAFAGVVALTQAAGGHPLGDGIRAVTLVGFASAPTLDRRDGRVVVEGDGVRLSLAGAEARVEGETIRVSLALGTDDRVARIEAGLLPPVTRSGAAQVTPSLQPQAAGPRR